MNDMMVMANAILPFILMAAIFYFMLWRPQKQEQKKRKELLDSLTRPDQAAEKKVPEPERPAEPSVDTGKLAGLSDDLLKTKEAEPAAEEPQEDLSEANAKLKDMLSGMNRKD